MSSNTASFLALSAPFDGRNKINLSGKGVLAKRFAETFELIEEGNREEIARIVAASTPSDFLLGLAQVAVRHWVPEATSPRRKLAEAFLRGLNSSLKLRKEAEPCISAGDVSRLLGISTAAIRQRLTRKHLLALPKGERGRVFPLFQFQDNHVVPGFAEALSSLATDSPYVQLSFFLSKNPDFGNRTALAALKEGKIQEVVRAARGFLAHGT